MKTNASKKLIGILLSLVFTLSMVLVGCGSEPATLEELVANDTEIQEQIDSLSASGMTVDITENTLTYTYQYDQVYDSSLAPMISSELEKQMNNQSSTFEGVRDTLIEETGFSDIAVKIVYLNGDGTELYSTQY